MTAAKVRRIDYSPDEFLSGTIELSDTEIGIYWRACTLIYSRNGKVSREALRRLCTSDPRIFNRCLNRLIEMGKLHEVGADLVNSRCTVELEFANRRSTVAAENVSKRWSKPRENNKTVDTGVILGGNANHQPSTIKDSPLRSESESPPPDDPIQPEAEPAVLPMAEVIDIGEAAARKPKPRRLKPSDSDEIGFEEAWRHYPKRVGKGDAIKAWKIALRDTDSPTLLAGVMRYAADRTGQDQAYTLHFCRWLSKKRWLDEPTPGGLNGGSRQGNDGQGAFLGQATQPNRGRQEGSRVLAQIGAIRLD